MIHFCQSCVKMYVGLLIIMQNSDVILVRPYSGRTVFFAHNTGVNDKFMLKLCKNVL